MVTTKTGTHLRFVDAPLVVTGLRLPKNPRGSLGFQLRRGGRGVEDGDGKGGRVRTRDV